MSHETFGSFLLLATIRSDAFGHLYRAGEITPEGAPKRVWLRVFDGDGIPARGLVEGMADANVIGEAVQGTNLSPNARLFAHDGVPALAWDYAPGQPLTAVLDRSRENASPFPAGAALLIASKLAAALTTARDFEVDRRKLVHGFLHPALVTASYDGQIVVSGFGVGDRLVDAVGAREDQQELWPYLAPEVVTSREVGPGADVYSVGAILFHLLTGEALPADPAGRDAAVESAVLADTGQPIQEGVRGLLATALHASPESRYSSSKELAEAVNKLMGDYHDTQTSIFDLAMLMYQLFREESEAEEENAASEEEIVVSLPPRPVLEPEPESELEEVLPPVAAAPSSRRFGLAIVAGAAVVAAAAVVAFLQLRPPAPEVVPETPTPTAEEQQAQQQAQAEQIAAMVDTQLQRLLAQKEEEIRAELAARQEKIDILKRQLKEADTKKPTAGAAADEEQKREAERLRRQLQAAEEEQRRREAELAEQKRQAEEDAQRRRDAALAALKESQAQKTEDKQAEQSLPTLGSATPTRAAVASAQAAAPPAVATKQVEPRPSAAQAAEVVTEPVKMGGPAPAYPAAALRAGVSGDVVLEVVVGVDGRVKDIRVLKDQPVGLTRAATTAVKRWTFKPATMNGAPVEGVITLTVNFNLPG